MPRRVVESMVWPVLLLVVLCALMSCMATLKRMERAGTPVTHDDSLRTGSDGNAAVVVAKDDFIRVDGMWLRDGESKPHFVQGINYWSCMNLGASDEAGGDLHRLKTELDQLANVGINHLRVMGATEGAKTRQPFRILPALQTGPGQWDERLFAGLDRCLAEAGKRGMRVTMVMGNTWQWTGGNAQVYSWSQGIDTPPFPRSWNLSQTPQRTDGYVGWGDWVGGNDSEFQRLSNAFYTDAKSIGLYKAHLDKVMSRKNTITGRTYSDDATIMTWEPINEPQMVGGSSGLDRMIVWHNGIAKHIKAKAPKQLVTTGFEAKQGAKAYKELHESKDVDYGCAHMWPQIWGQYDMLDPRQENIDRAVKWSLDYIREVEGYARDSHKPILLEEFGMPRDNWLNNVSAGQYLYDCAAPTTRRDALFSAVINLTASRFKEKGGLIGLAPWSYGGMYRSATQKYNNKGILIAGDPPQEPPCWFSILDVDHAMSLIADSHHDMVSFLATSPLHLNG